MRYGLAATALFSAILSLSACNTMEGIGRDLEAGGRAVARTAAQTQADMQATRADIAPDTVESAAPATPLTAIQARARALSARPGAVEKEEISSDGARYTFHIRGEDGGLYAVAVDAQTGAAVESRQ